MLRILENAPAQEATNILLELLIRTYTHNASQKTSYLIIKCISRISTNFVKECRPDQVKDYLLKVNEYISVSGLETQLEDFNPTNEKLRP
jgi:hypothetical protein